jgi:hypothetical protein
MHLFFQRGITSFCTPGNLEVPPKYDFRDFQKIIHPLPWIINCQLRNIQERSVTPNFHSTELVFPDRRIIVLGHSIYPIIAFTKHLQPLDPNLTFIDEPTIAQAIQQLDPNITIPTTQELNRPLTDTDRAKLDPAELSQIRYWQPSTLGQAAFNWWD